MLSLTDTGHNANVLQKEEQVSSISVCNATPFSRYANSYVTIEEADSYLEGRDGFDVDAWNALSKEQKALRLSYGAYVIDSLPFRGRKATHVQALQFPRIMPDEKLYESGSPFKTWEDLYDFADLMDVERPSVPFNVKLAQIEATYQVIHSHLLGIEAFENGENSIASLSIDVIRMTFKKDVGSAYNLFNKADFGAASTIKLLLNNYLSTLKGELV